MIPTIFITIGSVLAVKKCVKACKFNKFGLDRIGRALSLKNIFLIGAGNRTYELFIKPLESEDYPDSRIIGIYDKNTKRSGLLSLLAPYHIPVFYSLDNVSKIHNLDLIVILTPDYTHVPLISYLLKYTTATIMCEKPLCTTLEQAVFLHSLPPDLKKRISVLLNSRFMPINSAIKKILNRREIGVPRSIIYNWNIDIQHGSEYFRRWHSDQEKSGGLLVHKSCHHFDLLNWWLEDLPYYVSSVATTEFYRSNRKYAQNCRSCDLDCSLRINTEKQSMIKKMYFDVESEDGYIRDKCIYHNSNIHDTLSANIVYQKDTQVTYNINFYAPKFSWEIIIIGEFGTLSTYECTTLQQNEIVIDMFTGDKTVISIPKNNMKHNGADLEIRKILLSSGNSSKNSLHIGKCEDGISASMIGILSNISQKEGVVCGNPFISND